MSRLSKNERIASLERQVAFLNQQMQNICACPWGVNDGPRLATNPQCLIHGREFAPMSVSHGTWDPKAPGRLDP